MLRHTLIWLRGSIYHQTDYVSHTLDRVTSDIYRRTEFSGK